MPPHADATAIHVGSAGRRLFVLVALGLVVGGMYVLAVADESGGPRVVTQAVTQTAVVPTPTTAGPATLDWSSRFYPVDCGGPTTGTVVAYATPQDGTDLSLVFVTCTANAGSPPSAMLIFDNAISAAEARLRQTLLTYQDYWLPDKSGVTVQGPVLKIPAYGYSSDVVPRCCPDLRTTLTWVWNGAEYVMTSGQPAHVRLPKPSVPSPA